MHLTFGTGIFWLLMVSGIGEVIVRVAKLRGESRDGSDRSAAALASQVAELQQRLEQQTDLIHAQADTIARLEESTQFMENLLRGRGEGKALPPSGS